MKPLIIKVFSKRTLFGKRWFFHGRTGNNEIVFPSEAYGAHRDALKTAERIRDSAGSIQIDDSEFEDCRLTKDFLKEPK